MAEGKKVGGSCSRGEGKKVGVYGAPVAGEEGRREGGETENHWLMTAPVAGEEGNRNSNANLCGVFHRIVFLQSCLLLQSHNMAMLPSCAPAMID